MILLLYRVFTFLVYLIAYPFGRIRVAQGNDLWRGRLGLIDHCGPVDIWMHAASVGEAKVICYLVDYLKAKQPSLRIHVTTMTATGYAIARQQCARDGVTFSFFPIDTTGAIKRTLEAIAPRMIVVAETEIWPCLIHAAHERAIPIVLTNARMSVRAFGRYRHIAGFLADLLRKYARFFFKTAEDAERFRQFGVSESQGTVAGDMKFDAPMMARSAETMSSIRRKSHIPEDAFLIVAGSTRPGEEVVLAEVFTRLSADFPDVSLLIAPRHVERSDEIGALLTSRGLAFRIYNAPDNGEHVVLVDRLGLLNEFYLAASISFVGGTLADLGGHNLLEPVWAGSPVIFGPSTGNVKEAAEYILKHNYGVQIRNADGLYSALKKARMGDILYATKKTNSPDNSATAMVGEYILSGLSHA